MDEKGPAVMALRVSCLSDIIIEVNVPTFIGVKALCGGQNMRKLVAFLTTYNDILHYCGPLRPDEIFKFEALTDKYLH